VGGRYNVEKAVADRGLWLCRREQAQRSQKAVTHNRFKRSPF